MHPPSLLFLSSPFILSLPSADTPFLRRWPQDARPWAHKYTYGGLLSVRLCDAGEADVPFFLGHGVHDGGDVLAAAVPGCFVWGRLV